MTSEPDGLEQNSTEEDKSILCGKVHAHRGIFFVFVCVFLRLLWIILWICFLLYLSLERPVSKLKYLN